MKPLKDYCLACSKLIINKNRGSRYCKECYIERERELNRKYNYRNYLKKQFIKWCLKREVGVDYLIPNFIVYMYCKEYLRLVRRKK